MPIVWATGFTLLGRFRAIKGCGFEH